MLKAIELVDSHSPNKSQFWWFFKFQLKPKLRTDRVETATIESILIQLTVVFYYIWAQRFQCRIQSYRRLEENSQCSNRSYSSIRAIL